MDVKRLLPLSGVVFVALVVLAVAGLGGSTPGSDASAAKVASFYDDEGVRQGIAAFVLAASVPFLVIFGVGLATARSPHEEGRGLVWEFVLIAGTVFRRLGWIALVLGIALFIPFADFFALLLTAIWIIVTSVMMARGARGVGQALPTPRLEQGTAVSTTP